MMRLFIMYTKVNYFIKCFMLFFLFASCSTKYKIDYDKILSFEQQDYDSVDLIEYNFKNTINCSQVYIDKFELTDDENMIIGFWEDASWLLQPYNHKINNIGIYSFLPNRKFIKSKYIDDETVKILYGTWKVEDKKLKILENATFLYTDSKITNYTLLEKSKYISIFVLVNYEKYPINTTAFMGEKIPRYRRFHDFVNYGPDIYSPETYSGNLIFNPIESEEYLSKLLKLNHFYFY